MSNSRVGRVLDRKVSYGYTAVLPRSRLKTSSSSSGECWTTSRAVLPFAIEPRRKQASSANDMPFFSACGVARPRGRPSLASCSAGSRARFCYTGDGKHVFVKRFVPEDVALAFKTQLLRSVLVVPTMIQMLFALKDFDAMAARGHFSYLRALIYGASPMPEATLVKAMERTCASSSRWTGTKTTRKCSCRPAARSGALRSTSPTR